MRGLIEGGPAPLPAGPRTLMLSRSPRAHAQGHPEGCRFGRCNALVILRAHWRPTLWNATGPVKRGSTCGCLDAKSVAPLLALNCRRSRRLSQQLSGAQRTLLPQASEAELLTHSVIRPPSIDALRNVHSLFSDRAYAHSLAAPSGRSAVSPFQRWRTC